MESSESSELILCVWFYFMHEDPGEVTSLSEHHTTPVYLNGLSGRCLALGLGGPLLHCLRVHPAVRAAGTEMKGKNHGKGG